MKAITLLLVIVCLVAVSAELGASTVNSPVSATGGLRKKTKLVQHKVDSVSVVGAAAKTVATPAFDLKAAGQLAATFTIWYAFNAACRY